MAVGTLTYIHPPTGATPPTAAQVADLLIVDLKFAADADVLGTIPHLMGVAPQDVQVSMLISQALTALSAPAITTIDATNIVVTKLASTGSGSASNQMRVRICRPNTLGA